MNAQFNNIKEKAQKFIKSGLVLTTNHRIIIIFFIASAAILIALLQTKTYLNPSRNEARYQEEIVKIKYSTINQDVVDKLKGTEEDANINVDSNLVPDRSNPFNE